MKKIAILALVCFLALACNSEPSLQKYFVNNSQKKEFFSLDVSPSILNIKPQSLTGEQQTALSHFKKMNVLAFKKDSSNIAEYTTEVKKVKEILKGEKYQELMHIGSGSDVGSISYVGTDDKVDEFILFGNRKENGFAVIRVLGDNMTPNDIMQMIGVIQKSNIDMEQLKPLKDILQQKSKTPQN